MERATNASPASLASVPFFLTEVRDQMSDDESLHSEARSVDEMVHEFIDWYGTGGELSYEAMFDDGIVQIMPRAEFCDDGPNYQELLAFERRVCLPWDEECKNCGNSIKERSGCDECVCDECGVKTHMYDGVNYGCDKHPVL